MARSNWGALRGLQMLCAWMLVACLSTSVLAQDEFPGDGFPGIDGLGGFDPLGQVGGFDDQNPIDVTVGFEIAEGTDQGRLSITGVLSPGWHIYSLTQKPGGPTRTTISVTSGDAEMAGPFVPEKSAKTSFSDIYQMEIEEHEGRVVWTAPLRFKDAAAAKAAKIEVKIDALTCKTDGACIPLNETFTAKFKGSYEAPAASGEYRASGGVVRWEGELVPAAAAPGEQVKLRLTAQPDEGFHVYRGVTDDTENSTNFVMTQLGGLSAEAPQASSEPVTKILADGVSEVSYHEGVVTWTIPLTVPADAEPGQRELVGAVKYQACTDTSCRLEQAFTFRATLNVGETISDQPQPLAFAKSRVAEVLDLAVSTQWVTKAEGAAGSPERPKSSLVVILGMALIGGLILNLMPCVLPVVGLKLMALVDSAGDDHGKVFSHNMWYSLGLLSVFWILAAVAIGVRLSSGGNFAWGEQFTYWEFRLALAVLVFAMALSFLGVWEIPLPGFASGKGSQELQKQEGPAGAFFKGVFTTLLATPCSGPLLGAVFGFTLALPTLSILMVYSAVGLGMALPYILIGLVPSLVYWLPKPGPWMETVKQLMGFILLGTVAFLFAGFGDDVRVPVFVVLIGAWFACWWIGKVPSWKPLNQQLTAWCGGIATAALIGFAAFQWGAAGAEKLEWEPYSEARLAQLQAEGRTVMVDFTANWCVNCQVNYRLALNTDATADVVEELDAVPMLADWTDRNEAIGRKLSELNCNSIPILAIYPAGKPGEPIVLRDLVSQQQVIDALRAAGGSGEQTVAAR